MFPWFNASLGSTSSSSSYSSASSSSGSSSLETYVAGIASKADLQSKAQRNALAIQTISWEDTGRYKGSCWGPNISDMSLRVTHGRPDQTSSGNSQTPWSSSRGTTLPMIRYPNFADHSADIPMENFQVTVGNEKAGGALRRIPLKEYLRNIGQYVQTGKGIACPSMWCEQKDARVLTSAQFCVLPLDSGTTEFNVHLYNYQSSSDDPAVLVLVCSQKGTSAQAIFGGTTQLYFNNAGEAANYVAERLKDERKRLGKDLDAKMDVDEGERNALLIFQIPLVIKPRSRGFQLLMGGEESLESYVPKDASLCSSNSYTPAAACGVKGIAKGRSRGMDHGVDRGGDRGMDRAMLAVGKTHSKFEGIKDFTLERDTRFPIRCTFQFYLVTDQQDIPDSMWAEMKSDIDRVYAKATATGSLVTELNTGRPTEWDPNNDHTSKEFTATLPAAEAAKPMFAWF
jgi:hypothetical protein